MKITSNVSVAVDGATFIFKKPSLKDLLELKGKGYEEELKGVFARLLKVEGLEDSDGVSMTAEGVRQLDLPLDAVRAIMTAYNAEVNKLLGVVDDQKKTSLEAV